MALKRNRYDSLQTVLRASNEVLAALSKDDKAAYLICPSLSWAHDRRIQAAGLFQRGVTVATWDSCLEGLWQLYGDGRRIATPALCRKTLITQASLNKDDSPENAKLPRIKGELKPQFADELLRGYEDLLTSTIWSESVLGDNKRLSAAEQVVMGIYQRYEAALSHINYLDPRCAALELFGSKTMQETFIFEGFDITTPWQNLLINGLAEHSEVWHISSKGGASELPSHAPELQELTARLYTKNPGIQPTGAVRVGEAIGPQASPDVVVELINQAKAEGFSFSDIALLLPRVSSAEPQIFDALACHDINFIASCTVPLRTNYLGSTVLNLFSLAQQAGEFGEQHDAELLYALLSSPYFSQNGAHDAWKTQRLWRKNRALDATARLSRALAESNETLELLLILANQSVDEQWIEDFSRHLNNMVLTARSNGRRTPANLNDDTAAVRALHKYARAILPLRSKLDVLELDQLSVELKRSSIKQHGAESDSHAAATLEGSRQAPQRETCGKDALDAITILGADERGLTEYPVVILGDLSAASYPMSEKPSSLMALAKKLGVEHMRDVAKQQRALLLHAIEAASALFMFYRETFEATGDEARQSALWDELLANYHMPETSGEETISTKPEEIPPALEPYTVRVYEGDALRLHAQQLAVSATKQFERGVLELDLSTAKTGDAQLLQAPARAGTERAPGSAQVRQPSPLLVEPLSPTALEKYLQCPYAWFVDRRLKAYSIDTVFDAANMGSFSHEVLKHFYTQLIARGMQRVTPHNLETSLQLLGETFEYTKQRCVDEGRQFALTTAEKLKLDGLLQNLEDLIRRDAQFLPGFTPYSIEAEVGGETEVEYAGVKLRGYIDRIDANDRGEAVIIDYKLSSHMAKYGLKKEAVEFPWYVQGAIYARAAERAFGLKVVGSLFRSYGSVETRGVYAHSLFDLADKEMLSLQGLRASDAIPWQQPEAKDPHGGLSVTALDYSQYLDLVEEVVSEAIAHLRSGDIAPHPRSVDVCSYCRVKNHCALRRGS